MADRIDLISLNPTGTYQKGKATLRDKHVECRAFNRICSVSRGSVFEESPPLRFEAIDDLCSAIFPKPPLGQRKRYMLLHANDMTPIIYNEDDVKQANAKVQQEAQVIKQIARQEAAEEEATRALNQETQAKVMLMLSIGATFLMVVIALVAVIKLV